MKKIIIDEEFKHLMPALDVKTRESLESNLLENGCRDALVLWGRILIDGHNRYEICTKHGIPFETVSKEFINREAVLLWIIRTQVSRRNLTPIQLSHFRGLHYKTEKKMIGNRTGHNQHSEEMGQNDNFAQALKTVDFLASKYSVSRKTISRDEKLATSIDAIGEISPDAKRMILSGEVKVEKKALEELATASKNELSKFAREVANGTYAMKREDAIAKSQAEKNKNTKKDKLPNTPAESEKFILNKINNKSYDTLVSVSKTCDAREIKNALKLYIDTLVDLYQSL